MASMVASAEPVPPWSDLLRFEWPYRARGNQVTEASAKIIDFRAYRAGRLARSERLRDDVYSTATLAAFTAACQLFTFLACHPFVLLGALAPKQEPHEYP
ncbi:hypothetical protein SAMN05192541_1614 [Bradyrhizobium arachidis]|nr:hypothetical protein SAMN05192541_1614 [Bradyrhizobium arachidis]